MNDETIQKLRSKLASNEFEIILEEKTHIVNLSTKYEKFKKKFKIKKNQMM